jgi:hypothetical protein
LRNLLASSSFSFLSFASLRSNRPAGSRVADPPPLAPLPLAALGVLRQNEQHPTRDPSEDTDAVFGDWWVGRGTATAVHGFDGPAKVRRNRAIVPLPPGSVKLPVAIP